MDKRKLENILDKLNIRLNLSGYRYWITAVEIYSKNKIRITELYKEIAKVHNTTAVRVERALRHTIEDKKEAIQKYFNVEYKIYNSAFLALLTREMER